jgi:phage terminase small subunit
MTVTNHRSQLAVIRAKAKPKAPKTPDFPDSLPPEMEKEWKALIAVLIRSNKWVNERAAMLESYLINISAIRMAQRQMALDGGPIVAGRVHPASAIISRHTVSAAKVAAALCITGRELDEQNEDQPIVEKKTSTRWSV